MPAITPSETQCNTIKYTYDYPITGAGAVSFARVLYDELYNYSESKPYAQNVSC